MAIQNRRGNYSDFDRSKLQAGEWAVVQSGDPNTSNGQSVYLCFTAGNVKRMATAEDIQYEVTNMTDEIVATTVEGIEAEVAEDVEAAETAATTATTKAGEAAESAQEAASVVSSAIDTTLSIQGKAAESKTVGDSLDALYDSLVSNTISGSGTIFKIEDAAANIPLKSATVMMQDPTQELNGGVYPCVAGWGKNKFAGFSNSSAASDGITFTFGESGKASDLITISGTSSAANVTSATKWFGGNSESPITISIIANNSITISITGSDTTPTLRLNLYDTSGSLITSLDSTSRTWTYTPTSDKTIAALSFTVMASGSVMAISGEHLQIEEGGTATDYNPYENICPISHQEKVSVRRSGKNLIDSDFLLQATGWTKNTAGEYSGSVLELRNAFIYTVGGVPQFADLQITDQITVSFEAYGSNGTNSIYCIIRYTDETYDRVVVNSGDWALFTLTSDSSKIVKTLAFSYSNNQTGYIRNFQIEKGNTATAYEPYQGNYYDVDLSNLDVNIYDGDLALKVYKGRLNIITGELEVRRLGRVFDGTENFVSASSGTHQMFVKAFHDKQVVTANQLTLRACTHFPNMAVTTTSVNIAYYVYNYSASVYRVQFRPDLSIINTADAFNQFLKAQYDAGTPVEAWWTLSSNYYYIIQLTPQQIKTIIGDNYIYSNGENTEIEYRQDTKKYIEQRLNAVKTVIAGVEESAQATKNYAVGDFVIVIDELRKVTSAIASGENITNNNSTATTVAEQLKALYTAVS